MDIENKDKKQSYKNSYSCAKRFKYNGKEYFKGDKIKFTKKQAETAKKII